MFWFSYCCNFSRWKWAMFFYTVPTFPYIFFFKSRKFKVDFLLRKLVFVQEIHQEMSRSINCIFSCLPVPKVHCLSLLDKSSKFSFSTARDFLKLLFPKIEWKRLTVVLPTANQPKVKLAGRNRSLWCLSSATEKVFFPVNVIFLVSRGIL